MQAYSVKQGARQVSKESRAPRTNGLTLSENLVDDKGAKLIFINISCREFTKINKNFYRRIFDGITDL